MPYSPRQPTGHHTTLFLRLASIIAYNLVTHTFHTCRTLLVYETSMTLQCLINIKSLLTYFGLITFVIVDTTNFYCDKTTMIIGYIFKFVGELFVNVLYLNV